MAALKQQLQQKLQQKLSPQQIQLIRLLELTEIEFEERVQQELVDNPALEEGREESPDSLNDFNSNADEDGNPTESAEELSLGDYRTEDDIPDYRLEADNFSKDDKRDDIPFVSASSFHDFLESQLGEQPLDETSYQIAQYIIGNIDDNGYLQRPIQAITDDLIFQVGLDVPVSQVEEILQMIQEFEPAGVGASNLRECLLLQLERHEGTPANLLAYKIVDQMFDEFSKKHYDKIMRQCNVDEEELKQAIREITLLNPKPGSAWNNSYSGNSEHHIIPDFYVEAQDGELTIGLNNSNIPELHVSRDYQDMLEDYTSNKQNQTREKRDALLFVKQKLDAAQWFVNAVKQRQNTLLTTMQAIVDLQRPFFLEGDESLLRPMILKDVAERTGLDISTISRVSNSKYAQTNFGIFPLKYFFNDGYTTEDGEEMSVREIRKILKECIDSEDKKKPYTDDELTEILKQKGYPIARRTVAKYRQQLNIPVARLRK